MTYEDIINRKKSLYGLARKIAEAERAELTRLRAEIEADCGTIGHIFGPTQYPFISDNECCQICGATK